MIIQKINRREFIKKSMKSAALLSGLNLGMQLSCGKSHIPNKLNDKLYYIETRGKPFEIGRQYAERLGDMLISHCIKSVEILKERFEKTLLDKTFQLMLGLYQKNFPYLIEEMRGMAEASQLNFREVALSNFSAGIGTFIRPKKEVKSTFGCPWGNLSLDDSEGDGCTNVIFPKSDRGPIMGRTLDGSTADLNIGVVRKIRLLNGNEILCFTQLNGLSTVHGVNNKGLVVGEASLHFPSLNPHGVIRNHLPRLLLEECATVDDGIQFLSRFPVMRHGFHFSLLDKAGNAAIVERSPTEMDVRHTSDDPIFCTNHCATSGMRKLELSRGPIGDKNSDERYKNLEKLTSQPDFNMTLNNLKVIIQNHKVPGGICQHGDLEMYTKRSFLVISKQGKLLVSDGPGCVNKYHEFILE